MEFCEVYMRRNFIFLLFLISSLNSFSQITFWNLSSWEHFKIAVEYTKVSENYLNYAYVDMAKGYSDNENTSYYQFIREQKIYKNWYAHIESKGDIGFNWNSTYVGLAYLIAFKSGYVALEPLFQINDFDKVGGQFSCVGGVESKRFEISWFNDLSYVNTCTNYTEVRLWFKINEKLEQVMRPGMVFCETITKGGIHTPAVFLGLKFFI